MIDVSDSTLAIHLFFKFGSMKISKAFFFFQKIKKNSVSSQIVQIKRHFLPIYHVDDIFLENVWQNKYLTLFIFSKNNKNSFEIDKNSIFTII